jgi:hypothetical protein
VALAAGTAALTRAAHPDLDASQVAHRLRVTANPLGGRLPAPSTGWGMINPIAAVTTVLAVEARPKPPGQGAGSRIRQVTILAIALVGAVTVGALLWVRRRRVAGAVDDPPRLLHGLRRLRGRSAPRRGRVDATGSSSGGYPTGDLASAGPSSAAEEPAPVLSTSRGLTR